MSHIITPRLLYNIDLLETSIYDYFLGEYNVREDIPLIEHDIDKGTLKISGDLIYHLNGTYHIDRPLQNILKHFQKLIETKPITELKPPQILIEMIEPNHENTTGTIKIKEQKNE